MTVALSDFNWLDLLFVILLVGMAYKGMKSGVGGQILSLIGWFVLLFATINFYNLISEALFGFILQKWAKPLSFFTIAAIVIAMIKILERGFHLAPGEESSMIEKLGGMLIGAFRAAVLYGLIGMFLLIVPIEYLHKSVTESSKTSMFLITADAEIYSWMTSLIGINEKRNREDIIQEFLNASSSGHDSFKMGK